MLNSISALLNVDFQNKKIEETLWGVASSGGLEEVAGSFFNIPIVISNKVVGLMTVADTQAGFYKEEEMTPLYQDI